jgi:hypothetical protein
MERMSEIAKHFKEIENREQIFQNEFEKIRYIHTNRLNKYANKAAEYVGQNTETILHTIFNNELANLDYFFYTYTPLQLDTHEDRNHIVEYFNERGIRFTTFTNIFRLAQNEYNSVILTPEPEVPLSKSEGGRNKKTRKSKKMKKRRTLKKSKNGKKSKKRRTLKKSKK